MGSSSEIGKGNRQLHVLAVDDNVVERKLIEALLKNSSFKVTTAASGLKALEFLGWSETKESSMKTGDVNVNLIITDYCMPGMTGYELMKRVKESSNLREIPVVIMSSENIPTRIEKCLEDGAQEFLLKPIQPSDVKRLKCHMQKFDRPFHGRLCIRR